MIAVLFYLAWVIAIVLVAVGIYAMLDPYGLAHRYGVTAHTPDAAAFVRATGIRDAALGVVLGATAYVRFVPLLVVLAVAGIAVSIADLWIVSRHRQTKRHHAAHAIHASGIVAFLLVLAMALFAIGR